jgi:uncharacterized protein YggL (DUF469 family)
MSLIDQTYFVGTLSIANTDNVAILERLQYFIDKYEPELLQDIFGYELYKLLAAELQAEEDDSLSSYSTRFERLVNGCEYDGMDGRLKKWNGLFFMLDSVPCSLIANYVYWHWLKDQSTQTVGLGEAATQAQNAVLVSPMIKMNRVWNEMSRTTQELCYFLQSNRNDYPEWVDSNWVGRQRFFAPQNQFGI